jgi:hypothetical protein
MLLKKLLKMLHYTQLCCKETVSAGQGWFRWHATVLHVARDRKIQAKIEPKLRIWQFQNYQLVALYLESKLTHASYHISFLKNNISLLAHSRNIRLARHLRE